MILLSTLLDAQASREVDETTDQSKKTEEDIILGILLRALAESEDDVGSILLKTDLSTSIEGQQLFEDPALLLRGRLHRRERHLRLLASY